MMSERKRKRGRPRLGPVTSYEAEMKMRNNNISRNIKKPKYLLDAEEDSNFSTTSSKVIEERSVGIARSSRGYNTNITEDRNSEFHYGSDFEDIGSENEACDSDVNSFLSDVLSDDEGVLSDNAVKETIQDTTSSCSPSVSRPVTPDVIWLKDNESIPKLYLPPSADDLLIPQEYFMPTLALYEVLRRFKTLIRLSPFRFEEFCSALINSRQTLLLAEIHIALLRALIREDESQSTHFGPMDQRDSVNIMLYLIDHVSWPQVLYNYLQSDIKAYKPVVEVLERSTYPYTSLQDRLQVLKTLTDEVLSVSGVREELISEGKLRYDDHCRVCHKTGDLLCCDTCLAVYHMNCLEDRPPATALEEWTCPVCNKQKVTGVTDCLSSQELSGLLSRHDPLGYDRHGRKYWFLVRRLIVESSGGKMWYYSTVKQFRAVLSLLDNSRYEEELVANIMEQQYEFERQLAITEHLTQQKKGTRTSAIAVDDEKVLKFIAEKPSEVKMEYKNDPVKEETALPVGNNEIKTEVKGDLHPEDAVKKEASSDDCKDLWGASIVGRPWMLDAQLAEEVVKKKVLQLKNTSEHYRLGVDAEFHYANQYTSNPLALNKLQHNEERDKKRHLSHKFSVTCNQEFKWSGNLYGTEAELRDTLRQCLQQTEQQISAHYYHPHWSAMRKTWLNGVFSSSTPHEFARCLMWLVAAVKPVVFHSVWHEALGHINLLRVTASERDEKRRVERKEKKEQEMQLIDDYRNMAPVRFTKMPKHQLWKVKGEEYRLVCGEGWHWQARHRRLRSVPQSSLGLRAGPDKVMVGVKMSSGLRGLPVAPEVFAKLAVKTPGLLPNLLSPLQRQNLNLLQPPLSSERNEIIISSAGVEGSTQKVEVLETPIEQFFEEGLINVSRALSGRMRLVYPKVAAVSNRLDGLLAHRLAMPSSSVRKKGREEGGDAVDHEYSQSSVGEEGLNGGEGVTEDANIQEIPDSQRTATHRLRPAGNLLKEIRQHKLRYEAMDESHQYRCYSPSCHSVDSYTQGCFSPSCRAKARVREKLLNAVKNYTIVTSKPSPYLQVGIHDVIKLSEMDFSEKSKDKKSESRPSTPQNLQQKTNCLEDDDSRSNSSKSSQQISFRLEQDLDENSQSNEAAEHKFKSEGETTSGKVYLKIPSATKTKKIVLRLPQISTCRVGKDRFSVLVLPQGELRTAARRGWRHIASGFGHQAKTNPSVWPLPCPRPLFKLMWLFRTASISTLSGAALQLRILWSCLRWDDMQEKGATDGKRHITTDTQIVQTEILKRKWSGRFSEKTEYLRRKVTIPIEVQKPMREFTPSQRSGLRKRRRAQSPEDKRPESVEEWIPEEQLQLWEIRLFGERLERAAQQPKKDSPAIKINLTPATSAPSDIRQQMEEQLKQQRAAFRDSSNKALVKIASLPSGAVVKPLTSLLTPVKPPTVVNTVSSPTKKIMRTKDGRLISVQTLGSIQTSSSVGSSTIIPLTGALPKVQLSSQTGNKVIRLQTVSSNPRTILPRTANLQPVLPAPNTSVIRPAITTAPTIRLPNQNIQILRMPDGQIQVKGLLEGQQMIQRPDGKLQLVNNTSGLPGSPSKVATVGNVQVIQQKTIKPLQPLQQQVVKVNGQSILVKKDGAQVVSVGASDAVKAQGAVSTPTIVRTSPAITTVRPVGVQQLTIAPVVSNTPSTTMTLKVQVRMTEAGPKTIIQGLQQNVGLTKDHIRAIQQQVRTMLAEYKLKVGQLSPIMSMTLHVASQQQVTQPLIQQVVAGRSPSVVQPQLTQRIVQTPIIQNSVVASQSVVQSPALRLPLITVNSSNTGSNIVTGATTYIRTASGALIPAVSAPAIVSTDSTRLTIDSAMPVSTTVNRPQTEVSHEFIQQPAQASPVTGKRGRDSSESGSRSRKKARQSSGDGTEASPRARGQSDATQPRSASPSKRGGKKASPVDDSKKRQALLAKRDAQLSKHKDLLKKDILKKRAFLEKDLQLQIHKDLEIVKQILKIPDKKSSSPAKAEATGQNKRKRKDSVDCSLPNTPRTQSSLITHGKKQANKPISNNNKKNKNKNKKIVCICRTPFDDSKFYVGCDMCANWFHGDCVGITEAASRSMTEYVCDDCANAKLNQELYCFCRQPYDEKLFYICCEKCESWYHGRCIGIMQGEADDIDDYICPKCEPHNVWNQPCQKKLSNKDYSEIKKLTKAILSHKNAWPFLEAANPNEMPEYFKVVREPIDLRTVEKRVKDHHYTRLQGFVYDIMLLFDNSRQFNPSNSSFASCAYALESFFCSKVKQLKHKLSTH